MSIRVRSPGVGAVAAGIVVPRRAAVDRSGQPGERDLRGDRRRGVRRRWSPVRRSRSASSRLFVGSPTTATAGSDDAIRSRPSSRPRSRPGAPNLVDGDVFDLAIRGRPVTFRVVGRLDDFPGMARRRRVRRGPARLCRRRPDRQPDLPDGVLRRRTTGSSARASARPPRRAAGRSVIARHERYAAMRDAPLDCRGHQRVHRSPSWSPPPTPGWPSWRSSILHAQRRSREVGFLRTLGADRPAGRPADRGRARPAVAPCPRDRRRASASGWPG